MSNIWIINNGLRSENHENILDKITLLLETPEVPIPNWLKNCVHMGKNYSGKNQYTILQWNHLLYFRREELENGSSGSETSSSRSTYTWSS